MDNELIEELEKIPKSNEIEEDNLEESRFIANCLQVGFQIDDLKQMEYKEVAKILLCFREKSKKENRNATQADWDALAR